MFCNFLKSNILFILLNYLVSETCSTLLFPESVVVSELKPVELSPFGSTCGLDFKETLCDNRLQDRQLCSNSSNLIYCDQTCPYANVFVNLNKIEQLKLEKMQPCQVLKDYGVLLTKETSSSNSYLFDDDFGRCNNENTKATWKPFSLSSVANENPLFKLNGGALSSIDLFNSGVTISLWFQQKFANNG